MAKNDVIKDLKFAVESTFVIEEKIKGMEKKLAEMKAEISKKESDGE